MLKVLKVATFHQDLSCSRVGTFVEHVGDYDLHSLVGTYAEQRCYYDIAKSYTIVHWEWLCHWIGVAGWQGRLLNMAGKQELVRSVLTSLSVYAMTTMKLPKKFLTDLDKLRRRFL
jgi:hypothetical protein